MRKTLFSTFTELRFDALGCVFNPKLSNGITFLLLYAIFCQMFLPMARSSVFAQTTPQKISPVVECVIPGQNGNFTAWMGYNNPNAFDVSIPLGNSNKFTPAPVDRSQPTTFLPGRRRNVFALNNVTGNQVWTLNGKTATASAGHPTRCQLISAAITSPSNNSTTNASSITVSGTAISNGPTPLGISQVLVNGQPANFDAATNTWTINNVPLAVGANTITAVAFDNGGNQASSQITINRQSPNQPPIVNAGADQTVVLANGANLSGTVTDDGLPQGNTISVNWEKVSGPGEVDFENSSLPATRAFFSVSGFYVLRLNASDGSSTSSDDMTVNVTQVNQAPVVNAGISQNVTLPSAAILNGTVSDDNLPSNNLVVVWSKISGPGTVNFTNPNSPLTSASFATEGVYTLRLTASDGQLISSAEVVINARYVSNAEPAPFNYRSFNDSPWRDFSGQWFYLENFEDHALNTPGVTAETGGLVSVLFGPTAHDSVDADDGALDGSGLNGDNFFNLNGVQGIKFVFDRQILGNYPTHVGVVYTDGAGQTYYEAFDSAGTSLGVRGPFSFPITNHYGQVTNDFFLRSYNSTGISAIKIWSLNGGGVEVDHLQYGYQLGNPENHAPTVYAGSDQIITSTQVGILNGLATDDGLPTNTLTTVWSKVSGSGAVTFTNANSLQTNVSFETNGTYVLRLTVSDGQLTNYDELTIRVNPTQINQPPNVNTGADRTITLSQQTLLEAVVSDDGLPVGGSFSAAWTKVSGAGNVSFSNPNQTATYASFSEIGTYVLRLTVSDSALSASDDVTVTVVPAPPQPGADIQTPIDGARITEPTAIAGTISGGNWKLEYSLADTDDQTQRVWTTAASGTGAASGNLGTLDTTLMLNGLYDVRLSTTDGFGQTASDTISLSIENNLKVGHFTVSFEDMNVPVAGIPIQIIRTYDSRDKRKGDFGAGWTLGIKNVRVEKNNILGLKWFQTRSNTFIPNYCVEPTRPHIVTVTMPDGEVERFEARLDRPCQRVAPVRDARLIFAPQAGTRGTLSVVGDDTVYVAGSVPGTVELVAYDGSGIFDRTEFVYTAKDGTQLIVKQGAGLKSVRDTNGNTLTVSASGITHSSGKSIGFTRDAQGRITQITDPEGVSNVYTYNAGGDLISYKDRENNTTAFTYEPTIAHHLKSIVDPLGRTPIRNDYDASGRLLKHTDANGNEINYIHNLAARVETVQDRLGNQTVYNYDARGNVLQKTDALGSVTSFTYDANDNVLTETNALGKTTVYTYDAADNRTSVTDALGNRTEMTYNQKGQPLTVKDARGQITTNTYDTAGNLLTTRDAQGNVTTNTYSIQTGQLASSKDALDNLTRFEYVNSYLVKQTDAQNNETRFTYDQNGNRKTQTVKRTNAQGQLETITTRFEFDNLSRLTKTIQPDGSFTRTEYNALGQQAATVDQAGNRTEFEYDDLGRLVKTTYADGRFEESTFDAEGRRLTSKDRSGKITSYEYDALGRLKKTTYADGTFTQTAYDAAGQVLSSTDARGNATTYTYDDAGRRLTVKNALDQTTSFAYDANGNQLSMTDALNHTTAYVYDSLNRKTRTNFADSSFTETTFDVLGRRISEKDQAGKVTQFFYDSLGRLTRVKDALNQETRYEYNELGQQILQKDALNRETRYEYDTLGRRTKRILPLGQTETYDYDTQGNLQSKTDFNGKTTTFAYDSMRRLLSKTPDASLNQPTVSFTYNDLGQRATMTDASGTTVYGYDNRNRLASKQTPNGTLSYTYDGAGNIETLRSSNANGVSVDYDYDELNRLKEVKDNRLSGDQTTDYTYDAVGNLQSYSYPNQVTTSYAYNNLNRLTTMTVANASGNLASYQYTLGASGNRTQVVEASGRTVNYVYDDLYRLTSETIANSSNNGIVGYGYDAVGNRLQRTSSVNQVANQSSTYDANDRLNSDAYDANGNTKISNGKTYNYDFENKLASTSDGIQIVYDGDGNRVAKTVGGVTTFYLVDTNNLTGYAQVVEELQNNQVVKSYIYGLDLISQKQGAIVSFYHYDGHGSVRGLSNLSGSLTDTYDYDAFGTIINRTGTTENSYLYAGEQFDADLGFYYNRARYLNVETGRFISQDSYEGNASSPLSLHKYLYAHADGINKIDPSGYSMTLTDTQITGILIGIVATIAILKFVETDAFRDMVKEISESIPSPNPAPSPSPSPLPSPAPNPLPVPVPSPSDDDDNKQLHRGRIQAQGNGIWFGTETDLGFGVKGKYDTISYSWARSSPLSWAEGLTALENIKLVITKKQYKDRDEAFDKAERFINNSAKTGGAVAPATGSWQNKAVRQRKGNERVDIEVWEGRAFVP